METTMKKNITEKVLNERFSKRQELIDLAKNNKKLNENNKPKKPKTYDF